MEYDKRCIQNDKRKLYSRKYCTPRIRWILFPRILWRSNYTMSQLESFVMTIFVLLDGVHWMHIVTCIPMITQSRSLFIFPTKVTTKIFYSIQLQHIINLIWIENFEWIKSNKKERTERKCISFHFKINFVNLEYFLSVELYA